MELFKTLKNEKHYRYFVFQKSIWMQYGKKRLLCSSLEANVSYVAIIQKNFIVLKHIVNGNEEKHLPSRNIKWYRQNPAIV